MKIIGLRKRYIPAKIIEKTLIFKKQIEVYFYRIKRRKEEEKTKEDKKRKLKKENTDDDEATKGGVRPGTNLAEGQHQLQPKAEGPVQTQPKGEAHNKDIKEEIGTRFKTKREEGQEERDSKRSKEG